VERVGCDEDDRSKIQNLNVFVYGTLKPGECNFDRYCGENVISSHRAYILGELYHFPALGYPGAISGTSQVHGFVLTFTDAAILTNLDELENYHPARQPAENDYTRALVTTFTPAGMPSISAWAYLISAVSADAPVEHRISQWGGILVPDGWWAS
jgi:gamma-glutamylcyclotransferase (GGCT)/AIG2-like uncharacterized protein YtfP